MLVLSRKRNEQILIDGNITIEVLQVKGNTVRLGISAPRDVKVLRGELKPFGVQVIEAELPASMPIAYAG
jgi:carbon storage regulator CsrA